MSNQPGQMPPIRTPFTVAGVDYGKGTITLANHDDVFKFDRCCQVTLWFPPPRRSFHGRLKEAVRGIAYGWRGWL